MSEGLIRRIILFVVPFMVMYLLLAFAYLDLDLRNWDISARGICGLLALVASCIIVGLDYDEEA